MDSDTEYALIRRPTDVPAPADNARDDASEVMAEQQSIADVDTCIHQAAEALRAGRESVARSFFAQRAEEGGRQGSDPCDLLKTGRQRVLDQMQGQQAATEPEIAENVTTLQDLNRQFGDQIARLTGDVAEKRTRPDVFKVQLRAAVQTYLTSVERLFTRVTINVR